MNTQLLNGKWTVELGRRGLVLEGNVPGDVNDLLAREGIVPDQHFDVNARESYFLSSEPVVYSKVFLAEERFSSARLVLEGVDGFADIFLNGEKIKRVENAHRRYMIPIGNKLIAGKENKIEIVFTPIDELLGERVDELGGWREKRVRMRKPQYNFGWDWALPLPGIGVFGCVEIQYDYELEILDYSVKATLGGRIDFEFEVSEKAYACGYQIKAEVKGHGECESFTVNRHRHRTYGHIRLKSPKLWWPNGYGEQPLYDYKISLIIGDEAVQIIEGRIGIREITLLEEPFTPDAGCGYSFWLLVNGKRVFIKGGNWIPTELWPGKINENDYDYQIAMSKHANFNMLRVWGGGIYEKERFYRLCDENGIMVWQDFMFASAGYSVSRLQEEIIREATYQIKRLRKHTCVVLWCGCNEDFNSWSYVLNDADARELYTPPSSGEDDGQSDTGVYSEGADESDRRIDDPRLYTMILRGLVGKLAEGVPFVESSPISKDDTGNCGESGNSHISCWKYALIKLFRTGENFTSWREHFDSVCSFDSEFCDQGPCSTKYLKSFMAKENHWPPNDAWVYHIQRGHFGIPHYEQTLRIASKEFGEITTLEEYTKFGRANHLEMMRSEFESARFDYPNNGGAMMWMQNDCWPTSNWSIIEYGRNPKPCYYSAKRACENLLPIIFERKGIIYFAFSNNSFASGEVKAEWGERKFSGEDISKNTGVLRFGECETVRFGQIKKSKLSELTDYLYLTVSVNGKVFFAQPYFPYGWRNLKLPTPDYTAEVKAIEEAENGFRVTVSVRANSFVRLFHVYAEGELNPVLSDNYFDMEKGQQRTLTAYFTKRPQPSDILFGDFTTEWE